jgi:thiamine biosynthesis lipoprotein
MKSGAKRSSVQILLAAVCAVLIFAAVFFSLRRQQNQASELTTYSMGTVFRQTVAGQNAQQAEADAAAAVSALDAMISRKTEDSDISRLNRSAGGGSVSVSPQTARLLQLSLELAEKSGGAWDPTILPLSSLWDFDDDAEKVPAEDEILAAAGLVDYSGLSADADAGTASLAKAGMGVDLGGIGKGAACSAAVKVYRSAGVQSAIISAGGSSIGVFGTKSDGSLWRIAVRDPKTPDSDAGTMGELEIASGYVSTSGVYEKCFRQNGVLYHHLLNPKTGYPQQNGLVSVTVTAGSGELSDGLSTACFLLGREKAIPLLEYYGAGAVFVAEDGSVFVTQNLRSSFRVTNSAYVLSAD